jgi:2,4-dienoyl-CoA reductase-like NADH-dependent reductase (Old Yellow Enzyme family)
MDVVDAVRAVWPARKPLFVRLSATDWAPGGWDADQTVRLSSLLRGRGVDLVDVFSGGTVVTDSPVGPGYQVLFAARVRREAWVATGAVGLIVSPAAGGEDLGRGRCGRNPPWAGRPA